MKQDQTTGKTRLQFTRKAVAKLGKTSEGAANLLPITITLATLTQRCCGGEDSSRPVPSFCGGGAAML
jgi:hypothetical protein